MLTLPLEPTDDRANPAFKDAASCAQWLGQLQLTNLHQAHATLRTQLDELNRYPMRGIERMQALELLRETVESVQADYAKKLVAKKLPLSDDERVIFAAIDNLWQAMVTGYLRCLQSLAAGDTQLAAHGALLCHRCLLYGGLRIAEHLRTGYEFEGSLWRQLHELYAFCEEQGWQTAEVADELNALSRVSTCNTAYVKTLLLCHAHRADLLRNQLQWLDRWLTLWSPGVTVETRHVASRGDAPPLAVDLDSSCGLQLPELAPQAGRLRYLSMVPLSKLIRVKTILLQQGQSPQQLELGESCNGEDCISFLNYLHQCWCEGRDSRQAQRRATAQLAQMCYGMESAYAYLANKPFKQPGRDTGMDTLSRKQIAAFGRVLSDTNRHDLSELGLVSENWRIEDESIRGARLLRTESGTVRLGPGEVVLLRPDNASSFMAGVISWVKVTLTGQLLAGVRYLPGNPQPVSIKATGVNLTVSGKYEPALLLPELPALKIPASLVTLREWFKPGRVVEILLPDRQKRLLKMGISLEKGRDYERIGFTEIVGNAE